MPTEHPGPRNQPRCRSAPFGVPYVAHSRNFLQANPNQRSHKKHGWENCNAGRTADESIQKRAVSAPREAVAKSEPRAPATVPSRAREVAVGNTTIPDRFPKTRSKRHGSENEASRPHILRIQRPRPVCVVRPFDDRPAIGKQRQFDVIHPRFEHEAIEHRRLS